MKGKLDDAGSGTAACSVYGCSNFNAGCYADFSSDEVTFEEDAPEVVGFVMRFGDDDFSYWNGFDLTKEEKEQIRQYSVTMRTKVIQSEEHRKKSWQTFRWNK